MADIVRWLNVKVVFVDDMSTYRFSDYMSSFEELDNALVGLTWNPVTDTQPEIVYSFRDSSSYYPAKYDSAKKKFPGSALGFNHTPIILHTETNNVFNETLFYPLPKYANKIEKYKNKAQLNEYYKCYYRRLVKLSIEEKINNAAERSARRKRNKDDLYDFTSMFKKKRRLSLSFTASRNLETFFMRLFFPRLRNGFKYYSYLYVNAKAHIMDMVKNEEFLNKTFPPYADDSAISKLFLYVSLFGLDADKVSKAYQNFPHKEPVFGKMLKLVSNGHSLDEVIAMDLKNIPDEWFENLYGDN